MKKTLPIVLTAIFVAVVISVFVFGINRSNTKNPDQLLVDTNTVSNGTISFSQPKDFGFAITSEQILVKSYIPPCDQGFDYCLYYNGRALEETNFESAGFSIRKRLDLTTESSCLETNPDGYTGLVSNTVKHSSYSISKFSSIGDAAAGHYVNGEEYRLYTNNMCIQFDLRIGETQFLNYPTGSIKEFTLADRATVVDKLRSILANVSLVNTKETLVVPN